MGEIVWTFTPKKPPKKSVKKKAVGGAKIAPAKKESGRIRTSSPASRKAVIAQLKKLRSKYG